MSRTRQCGLMSVVVPIVSCHAACQLPLRWFRGEVVCTLLGSEDLRGAKIENCPRVKLRVFTKISTMRRNAGCCCCCCCWLLAAELGDAWVTCRSTVRTTMGCLIHGTIRCLAKLRRGVQHARSIPLNSGTSIVLPSAHSSPCSIGYLKAPPRDVADLESRGCRTLKGRSTAVPMYLYY